MSLTEGAAGVSRGSICVGTGVGVVIIGVGTGTGAAKAGVTDGVVCVAGTDAGGEPT